MGRPRVPIPWWAPAAWLVLILLLFPARPWIGLLGYHGLCGWGAWGLRPRWGRVPKGIWATLALGALLLPLLYIFPRLPFFPVAQLRPIIAGLPGGLMGLGLYSLTVNVALEELFWRGAMLERHGWPAWRHGLAFGFHHGLVGALRFGWVWAPLAFLLPAAVGALWTGSVRRTGGLGTAILTHFWADAALLCLAASQLR